MKQTDLRLFDLFRKDAPVGYNPLAVMHLQYVQNCAELRYQHYRTGQIESLLVHVEERRVIGGSCPQRSFEPAPASRRRRRAG